MGAVFREFINSLGGRTIGAATIIGAALNAWLRHDWSGFWIPALAILLCLIYAAYKVNRCQPAAGSIIYVPRNVIDERNKEVTVYGVILVVALIVLIVVAVRPPAKTESNGATASASVLSSPSPSPPDVSIVSEEITSKKTPAGREVFANLTIMNIGGDALVSLYGTSSSGPIFADVRRHFPEIQRLRRMVSDQVAKGGSPEITLPRFATR